MRFLKRHKFFLVFLGVLVLCSVMVIRQFLVNQWKHVDLREDFILLHDEGQTKGAEQLYQMLIQELPNLPDRALIADEQRLLSSSPKKNRRKRTCSGNITSASKTNSRAARTSASPARSNARKANSRFVQVTNAGKFSNSNG